MRITLPWGRNRDLESLPFHGRGRVRGFRFDCFRHHAAELDDGAGEIRALLLRLICRWSFCGRMGDGADKKVVNSSIGRHREPQSSNSQEILYIPRGSVSSSRCKAKNTYSGGSPCSPSPAASGRWAAPWSRLRSSGENEFLKISESMRLSRWTGDKCRMSRMARLTA